MHALATFGDWAAFDSHVEVANCRDRLWSAGPVAELQRPRGIRPGGVERTLVQARVEASTGSRFQLTDLTEGLYASIAGTVFEFPLSDGPALVP